MADQNIYEKLATELSAWDKRMMDKLPDAIRGGKAPPWSVHLSDDQIRAVYSRMTPEEAWQRWQAMAPEEQDKLARIMNRGGGR